jgi:predicted amidohydrolase YtcJ
MTINAAYLSFEETVKGSIEPGKYADITVLDRDYLDVPLDDIKDIAATMTILGGKIVHGTP